MTVNPRRIKLLKKGAAKSGFVVCWMSRDQRANDNWTLLFAQQLSLQENRPLAVVFCLVPEFLNASLRQYDFMLKGLKEVADALARKNIPFYLLNGSPEREIPAFVKKLGAGILVTDFDPLRIKRKWRADVAAKIDIPFFEVDAHNIVPCRQASEKQEYGAYTLRPRIHRVLFDYMEEFPKLKKMPAPPGRQTPAIDWEKELARLKLDRSVRPVDRLKPGEKAAKKVMSDFIAHRLAGYNELRNDPLKDGVSNLSPYLHFGHISAQRVAQEVRRSNAPNDARRAFLEELIVRRELSDNFCFYNENYDNFAGFPAWAQKSLNAHRGDARDYVYSLEDFEAGATHDELWNAAQKQMVLSGKMHGYLRMYWAKKILEWTGSPEEAMETAIYLNDKYELDGRDPNGYTGIAWSIGGVHDRAWKDRPIFGKIRYMSYSGAKGKFKVKEFVERWGVS